MTPIETVADILEKRLEYLELGAVADVLVPEQCMTVYIGGRAYHLTIEPFENQEENT